jgi:hypothetical protein
MEEEIRTNANQTGQTLDDSININAREPWNKEE